MKQNFNKFREREANTTPTEQAKKFTFDVGWVLTTSAIPLLIGFIVRPLLARWLGASGLGLYSIALVIYGMGMLVANFGISQSVIKYVAEDKDNKDKLHQIATSGFISSIIFGIIVGGLLYALSGTLAGFFAMPELTGLLPILVFAFPFASLLSSLLGLFNGLRQMKTYALLFVMRSSLMSLFVISFVGLGFGVKGAIFGVLLSDIGASIFGLYISRHYLHLSLQGYIRNTKKLLSFGGQMFGANATNVILNQIDIILIGYFLVAADVGYYSTAIAIASLFTIIPSAIQRITFPATSEFWSKNNHQALNKMIDKSMKYSACILLFVGLGVGFFAKEIMGFVFGPEFICAALPLCVLLIARVIRGGTIVPIGTVIPAIGRPDINLKIEVICAGMNVGLNILLIPLFGILGAAIATTISLLTGVVIFFIFVIKLLPVKIDFRWHAYAMGTAFIALVSFWGAKTLINSYLAGGIILCLYAILILTFFLTNEDRSIFISIAYSVISRK